MEEPAIIIETVSVIFYLGMPFCMAGLTICAYCMRKNDPSVMEDPKRIKGLKTAVISGQISFAIFLLLAYFKVSLI